MFRFSKFHQNFSASRGKIVFDSSKLVESVKNGSLITELVDFSDDYSSVPPMIKRCDFDLEHQLSAGIQLNRINVSNLLSPSDPASVQNLTESQSIKDFNKLQSEMNTSSESGTSEPGTSES